MSNRTQDLPSLTGVSHVIRELRYHEVSRQSLAIVLILLFTATARPIPALVALGAVLVLAGTLVRFYASGFILKNRELAKNGPYAIVRHPLYTGNLVAIIGFVLCNATWWAAPAAVAFFWFYYPPAIEYEDRKLERIFGAEWRDWSRETPALVPALGNVSRMGGGRWSFWKSLRHNGEIFIAIYVLICLGWIVRQTF
jgi:Phospholipid methyltransferase